MGKILGKKVQYFFMRHLLHLFRVGISCKEVPQDADRSVLKMVKIILTSDDSDVPSFYLICHQATVRAASTPAAMPARRILSSFWHSFFCAPQSSM